MQSLIGATVVFTGKMQCLTRAQCRELVLLAGVELFKAMSADIQISWLSDPFEKASHAVSATSLNEHSSCLDQVTT